MNVGRVGVEGGGQRTLYSCSVRAGVGVDFREQSLSQPSTEENNRRVNSRIPFITTYSLGSVRRTEPTRTSDFTPYSTIKIAERLSFPLKHEDISYRDTGVPSVV